jgi:NADH dehydrogenase (ubiquinone) 1 alpha subcomplex subunit 2
MSQYQELKKLHPHFPILVREASGAQARLVARYDFGVEKAVVVEGMSKDQIAQQIEGLVKQGEKMPRSTESL